MTLFRNNAHREVWIDRWCHTCFEPHEAARRLQGKNAVCPILNKALTTDHKPPEWERNTRADEMHRTIRCNAYQDKPPRVRKTAQQTKSCTCAPNTARSSCPVHGIEATVPLFDETPYKTDVGYVPVDGWPDNKPRKGKDVDHA